MEKGFKKKSEHFLHYLVWATKHIHLVSDFNSDFPIRLDASTCNLVFILMPIFKSQVWPFHSSSQKSEMIYLPESLSPHLSTSTLRSPQYDFEIKLPVIFQFTLPISFHIPCVQPHYCHCSSSCHYFHYFFSWMLFLTTDFQFISQRPT